jgi:hypothetical protein
MAVRVDSETLLASVGDVSESGWECLVNEAWEIFETEPRELGSALAEVRLRLCRCTTACRSSWLRGWRSWSGDAGGETYLDVPEGMPTFWAWRDWPSSGCYLTGCLDDGVRTAAFQRP